jgi:hypothetical protein
MSELRKLDGFREGDVVEIRDSAGRFSYSAHMQVILKLRGGREIRDTYWAIDVSEDLFRGQASDGEWIEIPYSG